MSQRVSRLSKTSDSIESVIDNGDTVTPETSVATYLKRMIGRITTEQEKELHDLEIYTVYDLTFLEETHIENFKTFGRVNKEKMRKILQHVKEMSIEDKSVFELSMIQLLKQFQKGKPNDGIKENSSIRWPSRKLLFYMFLLFLPYTIYYGLRYSNFQMAITFRKKKNNTIAKVPLQKPKRTPEKSKMQLTFPRKENINTIAKEPPQKPKSALEKSKMQLCSPNPPDIDCCCPKTCHDAQLDEVVGNTGKLNKKTITCRDKITFFQLRYNISQRVACISTAELYPKCGDKCHPDKCT